MFCFCTDKCYTGATNSKEKSIQTIIPHLWYDTEAKEAAELYVDLFANGLC